MRISYLADEPEIGLQLIPGLLACWRHVAPEDTWSARAERLRDHMNRDALPIAWVAHQTGRALGTAALRARDLDGREDLGPWLGGVYVDPEFRGRGVASRLCATVENRARELGYLRLYLITVDQQAVYRHLGWRMLEPASWRGHPVDIMVKDLAG